MLMKEVSTQGKNWQQQGVSYLLEEHVATDETDGGGFVLLSDWARRLGR